MTAAFIYKVHFMAHHGYHIHTTCLLLEISMCNSHSSVVIMVMMSFIGSFNNKKLIIDRNETDIA